MSVTITSQNFKNDILNVGLKQPSIGSITRVFVAHVFDLQSIPNLPCIYSLGKENISYENYSTSTILKEKSWDGIGEKFRNGFSLIKLENSPSSTISLKYTHNKTSQIDIPEALLLYPTTPSSFNFAYSINNEPPTPITISPLNRYVNFNSQQNQEYPTVKLQFNDSITYTLSNTESSLDNAYLLISLTNILGNPESMTMTLNKSVYDYEDLINVTFNVTPALANGEIPDGIITISTTDGKTFSKIISGGDTVIYFNFPLHTFDIGQVTFSATYSYGNYMISTSIPVTITINKHQLICTLENKNMSLPYDGNFTVRASGESNIVEQLNIRIIDSTGNNIYDGYTTNSFMNFSIQDYVGNTDDNYFLPNTIYTVNVYMSASNNYTRSPVYSFTVTVYPIQLKNITVQTSVDYASYIEFIFNVKSGEDSININSILDVNIYNSDNNNYLYTVPQNRNFNYTLYPATVAALIPGNYYVIGVPRITLNKHNKPLNVSPTSKYNFTINHQSVKMFIDQPLYEACYNNTSFTITGKIKIQDSLANIVKLGQFVLIKINNYTTFTTYNNLVFSISDDKYNEYVLFSFQSSPHNIGLDLYYSNDIYQNVTSKYKVQWISPNTNYASSVTVPFNITSIPATINCSLIIINKNQGLHYGTTNAVSTESLSAVCSVSNIIGGTFTLYGEYIITQTQTINSDSCEFQLNTTGLNPGEYNVTLKYTNPSIKFNNNATFNAIFIIYPNFTSYIVDSDYNLFNNVLHNSTTFYVKFYSTDYSMCDHITSSVINYSVYPTSDTTIIGPYTLEKLGLDVRDFQITNTFISATDSIESILQITFKGDNLLFTSNFNVNNYYDNLTLNLQFTPSNNSTDLSGAVMIINNTTISLPSFNAENNYTLTNFDIGKTALDFGFSTGNTLIQIQINHPPSGNYRNYNSYTSSLSLTVTPYMFKQFDLTLEKTSYSYKDSIACTLSQNSQQISHQISGTFTFLINSTPKTIIVNNVTTFILSFIIDKDITTDGQQVYISLESFNPSDPYIANSIIATDQLANNYTFVKPVNFIYNKALITLKSLNLTYIDTYNKKVTSSQQINSVEYLMGIETIQNSSVTFDGYITSGTIQSYTGDMILVVGTNSIRSNIDSNGHFNFTTFFTESREIFLMFDDTIANFTTNHLTALNDAPIPGNFYLKINNSSISCVMSSYSSISYEDSFVINFSLEIPSDITLYMVNPVINIYDNSILLQSLSNQPQFAITQDNNNFTVTFVAKDMLLNIGSYSFKARIIITQNEENNPFSIDALDYNGNSAINFYVMPENVIITVSKIYSDNVSIKIQTVLGTDVIGNTTVTLSAKNLLPINPIILDGDTNTVINYNNIIQNVVGTQQYKLPIMQAIDTITTHFEFVSSDKNYSNASSNMYDPSHLLTVEPNSIIQNDDSQTLTFTSKIITGNAPIGGIANFIIVLESVAVYVIALDYSSIDNVDVATLSVEGTILYADIIYKGTYFNSISDHDIREIVSEINLSVGTYKVYCVGNTAKYSAIMQDNIAQFTVTAD